MKMNLRNYLLIFCLSFFMASCEKGPEEVLPYENGIFVINEGNFQAGNGSITYYDLISGRHEQNIFQTVNNRPLGDVVQSLSFYGDYAYIVVNNSNKVEVVNRKTFEEVATIEGLSFPRHFLAVSENKGYISQWGDGFTASIAIIDLSTWEVTSEIITGGNGAEKMLQIGDNVWVGHSGGYGNDNIISIIDVNTDQVTQNITTDLYNPSDLVLDGQGKVWVLQQGGCGMFDNDFNCTEVFNGGLTSYNSTDFSLSSHVEFVGNYPSGLCINANGSHLYYLFNGSVYRQGTSHSLFETTPWINNTTYYYGLNAFYDLVYACDAKDYASQGAVDIFDSNGTQVSNISSGIIPRDVVVK